MVFEYKRPADLTIEAYGKKFIIPPKTAALVDGVMQITARSGAKGATAAEQANALRDGIALFIGEKDAEEIFPRAVITETVNLDEMSAFWFCLNEMSNKETEAVIAKYKPKTREEIKVTSNPKR